MHQIPTPRLSATPPAWGSHDHDHAEPATDVVVVDNHVYFYGQVSTGRCLALLRELRQLDSALRNERLTRALPAGHPLTPIWLHIHSFGGDIFPALAVVDQLQQLQTPVHSIVEGCCVSAATLLSMACRVRYIQPSALMLVHQLSSVAWGTYQQILDDVHMMKMLMETVVDFYTRHSRLSAGDVEEVLKRDSWFRAAECVERGLVDEMIG